MAFFFFISSLAVPSSINFPLFIIPILSDNFSAEKLFNDDIMINANEIVVDKNTNISLTKNDIEKKKNEYVKRITDDFNNIIKVYIENNSLVLVYNKKDLNDLFFENNYINELKIKYLK